MGRLRRRLELHNAVNDSSGGGGSDDSASLFSGGFGTDTSGSGITWITNSETLYIYDGNRVIQERDGANTPTVSYTRGSDLNGTLEGAGGIGGLLARSDGYTSGSFTNHVYYHADGNGNITYLVKSNQGAAAIYHYDAYGNLLSSSGALANANVYRFSSKEYIASCQLYYYLYRFYSPSLQRWVNIDPIEEDGGINLYTFVSNNPIFNIDYFGLAQEQEYSPYSQYFEKPKKDDNGSGLLGWCKGLFKKIAKSPIQAIPRKPTRQNPMPIAQVTVTIGTRVAPPMDPTNWSRDTFPTPGKPGQGPRYK
jgi:RHS repeat-associated protein